VEFAKLFGKKVEPQIKTVKVPPRDKEEDRWAATLLFEE
jgi:hypothetical protein